MKRLKYRHRVSQAAQIPRAGQAGGTGADHRHPAAALHRRGRGRPGCILPVGIGGEPLQPADGDRLPLEAPHTFGFALILLRTYPAADRGQGVGLPDRLIRPFEIPFGDLGDEVRDLHVHRAARNAGAVFAVEAAGRLIERHFRRITEGHLVEIRGSLQCRLFGHRGFFRLFVHCHNQSMSFPDLAVCRFRIVESGRMSVKSAPRSWCRPQASPVNRSRQACSSSRYWVKRFIASSQST